MKIRQGFVSNSSSSSFIVAIPQDAKLTTNDLINLFMVPKESPLFNMVVYMTEFLISELEQVTEETICRDGYYEDLAQAVKNNHMSAKLIADGWKVYNASFSNDGDSLEALLCDSDINIETPDLIMINEGY